MPQTIPTLDCVGLSVARTMTLGAPSFRALGERVGYMMPRLPAPSCARVMILAWIFSSPQFSAESLRASLHSSRNSPARTGRAQPSKKLGLTCRMPSHWWSTPIARCLEDSYRVPPSNPKPSVLSPIRAHPRNPQSLLPFSRPPHLSHASVFSVLSRRTPFR